MWFPQEICYWLEALCRRKNQEISTWKILLLQGEPIVSSEAFESLLRSATDGICLVTNFISFNSKGNIPTSEPFGFDLYISKLGRVFQKRTWVFPGGMYLFTHTSKVTFIPRKSCVDYPRNFSESFNFFGFFFMASSGLKQRSSFWPLNWVHLFRVSRQSSRAF